MLQLRSVELLVTGRKVDPACLDAVSEVGVLVGAGLPVAGGEGVEEGVVHRGLVGVQLLGSKRHYLL